MFGFLIVALLPRTQGVFGCLVQLGTNGYILNFVEFCLSGDMVVVESVEENKVVVAPNIGQISVGQESYFTCFLRWCYTKQRVQHLANGKPTLTSLVLIVLAT